MTTRSAAEPWNTDRDYGRILRVQFNEDRERLSVWFADGSSVEFDPRALVPNDLKDVDWWRAASNQIEVIVPHQAGWFEIPWDVIRRETDPAFLSYWNRRWAEIGSNRFASHAIHESRPDQD